MEISIFHSFWPVKTERNKEKLIECQINDFTIEIIAKSDCLAFSTPCTSEQLVDM